MFKRIQSRLFCRKGGSGMAKMWGGNGNCIECKCLTPNVRAWINPKTLRRTYEWWCDSCRDADTSQKELRRQRALSDWKHVKARRGQPLLALNEMPEQYPGFSRFAIREFWESGAKVAMVTEVSNTAVLNESIISLGLEDKVYAEQRGGEIVLRRTA